MEAQTDVQTYMEQGRLALAQGQPRDAAIAFAHAAQLEPDNPAIHLGLAEANLGLRSYGVVSMACRKVQELQASGYEHTLAQALLDTLDRRYDRALQNADAAIAIDPTNAYAHALRAYLLRAKGQDYDAGLARARAARLSYGGRFENAFPPIEQPPAYGYGLPPTLPANGSQPDQGNVVEPAPAASNGQAQRDVPQWSRPGPVQRQVIRTRFALSRYPRIVTFTIIAINTLIYVVLILLTLTSGTSLGSSLGSLGSIDLNTLVNAGAQTNIAGYNQFWRIFTAMFLHFNLLHIGLNMLSLFFIGSVVEVFYGKLRYILIYLLSGIVGGIVTQFTFPATVTSVAMASQASIAAGASGAIFGVFGALGVFYIVNRRALGAYGTGAIMNWIFWLALNLYFGFSTPGIGIQDHLGGLAAGIVLGLILLPRLRPRQRKI